MSSLKFEILAVSLLAAMSRGTNGHGLAFGNTRFRTLQAAFANAEQDLGALKADILQKSTDRDYKTALSVENTADRKLTPLIVAKPKTSASAIENAKEVLEQCQCRLREAEDKILVRFGGIACLVYPSSSMCLIIVL